MSNISKKLPGSPAAPAVFAAFILSAALPGEAYPSTASPLAKAKTFQVTEIFSRNANYPNQDILPQYSVTVKAVRPDKLWVEMQVIPGSVAERKSGARLYVCDGKTQYEYRGRENTYAMDAAPRPNRSPTSMPYGIYTEVNIPLLLHNEMGVQGMFSHLNPKDTLPPTKTETTEIVDGKPMKAIVVKQYLENMLFTQQLWTDAVTGLPFRDRRMLSTVNDAKSFQVEQIDFSDWRLNEPIDAAQLEWKPPATAMLHTTPPLPKDPPHTNKDAYKEPERWLTIGTPTPDFKAITPDGRNVHLSDLKGKLVILDFWATWCDSCLMSMPHLQDVYEQVKHRNVAVLALCVGDDRSAYDKWAAEKSDRFTFPLAFDPAGKDFAKSIAKRLYHVTGIPMQYVIDKDGKVSAVCGGYEDDDHRLEDALGRLDIEVHIPK